ncbi:hypothetical protein Tco_1265478 [Tanacetum coccineum]
MMSMIIRAERLAKSENPLALLAAAQPYSDNYYQAPKPQDLIATSSISRNYDTEDKLRGIRICKKEFAHLLDQRTAGSQAGLLCTGLTRYNRREKIIDVKQVDKVFHCK